MWTVLITLLMAGTGDDVGLIFQDHCVKCHRAGGMAPFSVETYDQARPWAKSMARAVATREMPPFGASGPIGKYADDPRLTDAERDAVIAWTQSPQRYNKLEYKKAESHQSLLIGFEEIEIPGDGEDHWYWIPGPATDVRISGWRWSVPDSLPIHHASILTVPAEMLTEVLDIGKSNREDIRRITKHQRRLPVSGYFPGNSGTIAPDGHAISLRSDRRLVAAIHVGPQFEPISTRGLAVEVLLAQENAPELPATFRLNFRRRIGRLHPGPQERSMSRATARDMLIHSVWVHMHELGRGARVSIDGEDLILIPRYDFDWQLDYTLAEPVLVKAGSEIEATLVWENDTGREVRYGQRSEDEMGIVELVYTVPGESLGG